MTTSAVCVGPMRLKLGPLMLLVLLLLGGQPTGGAALVAPAPQPDQDHPDRHQPGPLLLEDACQPLLPRRQRTEADEDHLEALALFATGRMLQRQGDYAQALQDYERAFRYDPEAVTVGRAVVPLAFALKRHAEAIRYMLKVAELEGAAPELLQQLAAYLMQLGDLPRAIELYEKALAARSGQDQSPADLRSYLDLGRLYFLAEDYGKGADCFAKVIAALEHPDQSAPDGEAKKLLADGPEAAYCMFGECFLRAGRVDEALAAFQKANQLAPNKALLELNLAQVHAHSGKPAEALASLEACFQDHLAGRGAAPYELLATVLKDLGRPDELIPRLEKLHADDPGNLPLASFLADQYLEAKQPQKAEPLCRGLAEKTPPPPSPILTQAYRNLVRIYREAKQPDRLLATLGEMAEKTDSLDGLGPEAEAVCGDAELLHALVETAREKHKHQPQDLSYAVAFALGLLNLEAKQAETAAEFFNLALQAKPKQTPDVLLAWGVGLLLNKQAAEAAAVFQRAIDEKALPEDDPRFYYLLAGALEMDGQTDKALAAAAKAAATKEDLPWLRSRTAWILYHARRTDQAIEAYRKLIDEFDADYSSSRTRDVLRDARLALSNLYVTKDDLPQAEELLQQVLDEFPDDIGALNDLGFLWADQGKHVERALTMIRKAVDGDPENAAYRDSLGWVLYRLGRYPEAVVELEQALAADQKEGEGPDPLVLDHLGDAYLKAGRPEDAKQAWQRAVEAFEKAEQPQKAETVMLKINPKRDTRAEGPGSTERNVTPTPEP